MAKAKSLDNEFPHGFATPESRRLFLDVKELVKYSREIEDEPDGDVSAWMDGIRKALRDLDASLTSAFPPKEKSDPDGPLSPDQGDLVEFEDEQRLDILLGTQVHQARLVRKSLYGELLELVAKTKIGDEDQVKAAVDLCRTAENAGFWLNFDGSAPEMLLTSVIRSIEFAEDQARIEAMSKADKKQTSTFTGLLTKMGYAFDEYFAPRELVGTEKQVAWAQRIRRISGIKLWATYLATGRDDIRLRIALSALLRECSSVYWINSRDTDPLKLLVPVLTAISEMQVSTVANALRTWDKGQMHLITSEGYSVQVIGTDVLSGMDCSGDACGERMSLCDSMRGQSLEDFRSSFGKEVFWKLFREQIDDSGWVECGWAGEAEFLCPKCFDELRASTKDDGSTRNAFCAFMRDFYCVRQQFATDKTEKDVGF